MTRFLQARTGHVLSFLILAGLMAPALAMPFPFFDEGAKDKEFAAFRSELIAIADRQDLKALRPHIHPNAISSFGGQQGWDMLVRAMQDEPQRWAILSDILRKGGGFRREGGVPGKEKKVRAFYAPYTFFAQVSDALATAVLTGPDVPVYAAPSTDAKIIQRFSDEALAVVFGGHADNQTWFEVKMPNGRSGFVSGDRVATDAGDRVGFVKYKGKWTIHAFVAGD